MCVAKPFSVEAALENKVGDGDEVFEIEQSHHHIVHTIPIPIPILGISR